MIIQVRDRGNLAQMAAVDGMGSGQVPGALQGHWLEHWETELSGTEAGKTEGRAGRRGLAGLGWRRLPDG